MTRPKDELQRKKLLEKLSKISKVLSIFFLVIAVSSLCFSALPIWYSITSALESDLNLIENLLYVLKIVFSKAVDILVPLILASVFRDIGRGNTPFSDKQSRRFLILGVVLLIYTLLQTFAPPDPDVQMQLADGLVELRSSNRPYGQGVFHIDKVLLFSSIACFCMSLIFKYGALLQELADETI